MSATPYDPFQERTMTGDEILADLRRRVAALEASGSAQKGCVCPAGAESTCRGIACPRRSFGPFG